MKLPTDIPVRIPRLPEGITACLFDRNGALTDTARLHVAAWKQAFGACLRRTGEPFRAFDAADYDAYVS